MTSNSVYIAGVGVSQANAAIWSAAVQELAISAGAKALLDAGVTYDDINHSVACFVDGGLRIPKTIFNSFGKTGASVSEVDCQSGLTVASQTIISGSANCTLVIGVDKGTAQELSASNQAQIYTVAIVLVSHDFITSHAYLKDSSVLIRASAAVSPIHSRTSLANSRTIATRTAIREALKSGALLPEDINVVISSHDLSLSVKNSRAGEESHSEPESLAALGSTGLLGLCELVWQLRGWTRDRSIPGVKVCLQCTEGPDGTAYVTIVCRADGNPTPKWKDIEHVRDGRERLGHNPAVETRSISFEDWLAVKSRDEFVPETTKKLLRLRVKGGDRAALARL